jgi:hypothetical protein
MERCGRGTSRDAAEATSATLTEGDRTGPAHGTGMRKVVGRRRRRRPAGERRARRSTRCPRAERRPPRQALEPGTARKHPDRGDHDDRRGLPADLDRREVARVGDRPDREDRAHVGPERTLEVDDDSRLHVRHRDGVREHDERRPAPRRRVPHGGHASTHDRKWRRRTHGRARDRPVDSARGRSSSGTGWHRAGPEP